MSVSRALQRLLRIRGLEEEQRRLKLEAALARLRALEQARDQAAEIEKQGRARVVESARSGELADRVAGLVQSDAARARMRMLEPRIASAEIETIDARREFLEKRVERRQAATLIEQATAKEELEQGRRSQGSIDELFAARIHRKAKEQEQG
jgi:flagellar export protein FliJ